MREAVIRDPDNAHSMEIGRLEHVEGMANTQRLAISRLSSRIIPEKVGEFSKRNYCEMAEEVYGRIALFIKRSSEKVIEM